MYNQTPRVVRFHKRLHVIQPPRWRLPEPIVVALLTAFIVGSWAGYVLATHERVCL